jgi:hypothetical protein
MILHFTPLHLHVVLVLSIILYNLKASASISDTSLDTEQGEWSSGKDTEVHIRKPRCWF